MSKETQKNPPLGSLSYGRAYIVMEHVPNHTIGRILTIIDALGLRENQEKSLKDLITQEFWSAFNGNSFGPSMIPASIHDEIRRVSREYRKEVASCSEGNYPISDFDYEAEYKIIK